MSVAIEATYPGRQRRRASPLTWQNLPAYMVPSSCPFGAQSHTYSYLPVRKLMPVLRHAPPLKQVGAAVEERRDRRE